MYTTAMVEIMIPATSTQSGILSTHRLSSSGMRSSTTPLDQFLPGRSHQVMLARDTILAPLHAIARGEPDHDLVRRVHFRTEIAIPAGIVEVTGIIGEHVSSDTVFDVEHVDVIRVHLVFPLTLTTYGIEPVGGTSGDLSCGFHTEIALYLYHCSHCYF